MTEKLNSLRNWLLIKLANGRPVAINLHLKSVMHIDSAKSGGGGLYCNVRVPSGEFSLNFDDGEIK